MKGRPFLKKSIFAGVCLIVGALGGYFFHKHFTPVISATVPIREDSSEYKLINPLLFLRTDKDSYVDEFRPMVASLNKSINDAVSSGKAQSVSIYFNDLNDAHWTGINETANYAPSSMLKVVIMIATLKLASEDKLSLSKELYYEGPDSEGQYYKPQDKLAVGYHTIHDLILAMILDSNNGAMSALSNDKQIHEEFDNVYKVFRLNNTSATTTDFMSPRSYSSILRILYNGGYISPDIDDQILEVLTKVTFDKGLLAGLPKGMVLANKFGEHTEEDINGNVEWRELHDCGIVYYPGRPYLLCVMTKGQNFADLETVIGNASKIVYDYINQDKAK